jgi:protein-tyrosine phosphatase
VPDDAPARILAVCTGNICRSPLIERLLAARLTQRFGAAAGGVVIRSAGSWGHEGDPMEPFAADCVVRLGGDPAGFVARELQAGMVTAADLVLGATREHRAAAVTLAPAASRRCFTLLEFARLVGPVQPGDLPAGPLPRRVRALAEAAAGNRGFVPAENPSDDDIEDPYGAPQRVFDRVAEVIDRAITVPVDRLAG